MISIVAPVKDEEKVVGRLLKALLRLNYPREKMEILIVEDGSADGTFEICREYAQRYPRLVRLLHKPISDGKPSALNFAVKHARGEVLAVFDADSVPEADVLLKAAGFFEDSRVAAVQGRPLSINAEENMLTKFVSYEEAVEFEAYIRGKDVLNLFVPLMGSCYFVRKNALERVGGWDEKALSEDMELAARLTAEGFTVKYAGELRSWQETPSTLQGFFKQRARWFRGTMEVGLKYGRLVKNFDKKSLDAEVTLAGPFIFLPCIALYLFTAYSIFTPFQQGEAFHFLANTTTAFTAVLLALAGAALTYAAKPRKISNLLWLPFIYAYWTLQNFVAFYAFMQIVFRRPKRWVKTVKTGAATETRFMPLDKTF
jgi:cellulose synthase/poly-beta-1,6-N-acetylglucosamine synthase-like glycosyltransferase